jgi:hypothetical protein
MPVTKTGKFVILREDGTALTDLDTGDEYCFGTRDEAEVFRTVHKGSTVVERQAVAEGLCAALDRLHRRYPGPGN